MTMRNQITWKVEVKVQGRIRKEWSAFYLARQQSFEWKREKKVGKQYLDLDDKTAIKNDKIQYAYLNKILNVTSPYSPKKETY